LNKHFNLKKYTNQCCFLFILLFKKIEKKSGEKMYKYYLLLVSAIFVFSCGNVKIDSEPDGAAVFIDGQEKGTTPLRLDLNKGHYKVVIKKDDFAKFEKNLIVGQSDKNINAKLLTKREACKKNGGKVKKGMCNTCVKGIIYEGFCLEKNPLNKIISRQKTYDKARNICGKKNRWIPNATEWSIMANGKNKPPIIEQLVSDIGAQLWTNYYSGSNPSWQKVRFYQGKPQFNNVDPNYTYSFICIKSGKKIPLREM
jgi:hypothetical protein